MLFCAEKNDNILLSVYLWATGRVNMRVCLPPFQKAKQKPDNIVVKPNPQVNIESLIECPYSMAYSAG